MMVGWGIETTDMGIEYRYFSYDLLLFANLTINYYWLIARKQNKEILVVKDQSKSYKNSTLSIDLANAYKTQLLASSKTIN